MKKSKIEEARAQYARVCEKIVDIITKETDCPDRMVALLGYTVSMMININFFRNDRLSSTLYFVRSLINTIDQNEDAPCESEEEKHEEKIHNIIQKEKMTDEEKQILWLLLEKSSHLEQLLVWNRETKQLDNVKTVCMNGPCIQLNLQELN